ncbi:hypothetical protein ACLUUI_02685 [Enterobacterales bacterium AW_CKDN230030176-1A_HGKHYDSX7]
MPAFVRHPWFTCLLASLSMLLAMGGFWYTLGKPVHLPDAASAAHRLQCASYTPFDKDQSPFDQPFVLRPARLDADLALLARRFQCIRTYSMTGLEAIPALARQHGLKVMLGAWVNAAPADTDREVAKLIAAANANPDVVTAVIVVNETLLRKDVTEARLVELIERVKREVQVPVTYADVWEFWLQHPRIAPAVDFLTIHLLPYWEDDPRGIDDALAHVAEVRRVFGQRFAPKPILIGETGWPSQGRQRDTAVPSRVNEARFIRGFVALAEIEGWSYNLIEAFDQPWKRASEGAVGGYWGLYDADRQDKGILEGPVSDLPHWQAWWWCGAGVLAFTLGLAGRPRDRRTALWLPSLAAVAALSLGLWGKQSLSDARFASEGLWAALLIGLNLVVLTHAALALGQRQGWRGRTYAWLQARAHWLLLAAGFAAAVSSLALVFDPRYRSFPSAALLLPALVYLVLPVRALRPERVVLGGIVGLGIVPQLYQEGLANGQALGWAGVSTLMVGALWLRQRGHEAP